MLFLFNLGFTTLWMMMENGAFKLDGFLHPRQDRGRLLNSHIFHRVGMGLG